MHSPEDEADEGAAAVVIPSFPRVLPSPPTSPAVAAAAAELTLL